ncbi:Predicted arabinose efflux permease, MFS family [Lentzea fradiae]|uniref:Predicted arabinose efflux permease, MFS family n=1 Tax=Lentzea fradiae TaxID=200378 RepID=A0A1G7XQG4_9PSEU|nr:MFS transporter [Lentzea fradiae]SDG86326.1 Predicted arabinose efflux permease, MFS family [Lentzea fradiae]
MNRDFRYYWSAEVSTTFGATFTSMAIATLGVIAFNASPSELGFVSAAAVLPACVFGLLAGVIGDRLRRPRRVLIGCNAAGAALVLFVALGIGTGVATIWWLAALCFVLGCVATVVETVYFTHLRSLVPPDQLTAGRARLQTGEYGARTAGQALAGVLIATLGGAVALVIDAMTYLVSLVLLTRITAPDQGAPREDETPGSFRQEIGEGFRQVAKYPFLRTFGVFTAVRSMSIGALSTVAAPFLLRELSVPLSLYGALFAVSGLAGLTGSLAAGRLAERMSLNSLAVLGSAGTVAAAFVLPSAGGPLPVAIAIAVLGLALPTVFGAIANVGLSGALTELVPENALGRAIASLRTVATMAQILGALGGGLIADAIGLRPTVWACAGLALVGCVPLVRAVVVSRKPEPAEEPAVLV